MNKRKCNTKIIKDFTATCECGKITTYSTIYNANSARKKGRCASCARAQANVELWKDEEFRKRRGIATSERLKIYWSDEENKKALSIRTTIRNIERWKDEEYKVFMLEKTRYSLSFFGNYNGHHFRSSLELKYMIEFLQDIKWISGESKLFAIKYMFQNKVRTYYPDFVVDKRIIEIKPTYLFSDPIVIAKRDAAEIWCKEKGYTYELVDPGSYNLSEIIVMHNSGTITIESKKLLESIKNLNQS